MTVCILRGPKPSKFAHNDVNDLDTKIAGSSSFRKLILVENLYSLTADLSPLPEIVEVAKKYGAWIFLDDAHEIDCVYAVAGITEKPPTALFESPIGVMETNYSGSLNTIFPLPRPLILNYTSSFVYNSNDDAGIDNQG